MSQIPKRKRNELEDSDDDEPTLGKQILPVANLPADFSGEPMDGMEYLFTVRRDARSLPHVTRVNNPYERTEAVPAPTPVQGRHPHLPSDEWRTSFEKHFRNFRKNVTQSTTRIQLSPRQPEGKLMPDKKERDCWWAFLSGKPETEWNPPKKSKRNSYTNKRRRFGHGMRSFSEEPDSDTDSADEQSPVQETWRINEEGEVELALQIDPSESLPTPSGTPGPQDGDPDASPVDPHPESSFEKPREPTPSLVQHIDHKMSLHLLMYFTHWINLRLHQPEKLPSQLTETHARWIFVLLSRVDDYVTADDMNLLRHLARACFALLKEHMKNNPKSEEVEKANALMSTRSCWMVITAVAGIWGQRDLWMDAEADLRV